MGCNIQAHLEIRIAGQWHYYSLLDLHRNYDLFAKMANVRNSRKDITPISELKGLPDDVSFMTAFHSNYAGKDGQWHSWLDYNEMLQLLNFIEETGMPKPWGHREEDRPYDIFKIDDFGVWLFGERISEFDTYPESYPSELEDIRMVFWFDD